MKGGVGMSNDPEDLALLCLAIVALALMLTGVI